MERTSSAPVPSNGAYASINDPAPAEEEGSSSSRRRFLILICIFSSLGGILFGYDIGVVSGVKTNRQFLEQFEISYSIDHKEPYPYPKVSGWETWLVEAFVSSLLAGCAVGALLSPLIADRYGRKYVVFAGAVLFVVSTVWVAASPPSTFWSCLIPARIACGLAVGVLSFGVPLYISEIAPSNIRGTLVSLQQLSITLGVLGAFCINLAFLSIDNPVDNGWRYSVACAAVFGVLLAVGAPFLPESPRWLLQHKGRQSTLDSLLRMRSAEDAALELAELEASFEQMQSALANAPTFSKVLRETLCFRNTAARRVRIAMAIQLFQQLTGINVVLYFAPEIFADVSPHIDPLVPTAIIGAVNVVFTIAALWLVERSGRRRLFIGGSAVMGVSVCVVGVLSATTNFSDNLIAGHAVIALLLLFVAGFGTSWGPLGWLYPAEILPQSIRAKGMALSTATNWVMNFAIGLGALSLFKASAIAFWFLLVGLQIAMAVFIYIYALETRGKTLEEVNEMYETFEDDDEDFDARYPMSAGEILFKEETSATSASALVGGGGPSSTTLLYAV